MEGNHRTGARNYGPSARVLRKFYIIYILVAVLFVQISGMSLI